ncbi:MAG: tRNA 2-selenouridine(34) synthase MnmH [Cyanobacteria bacterium MAG APA_bin_95]|uniref:tRNA 2-selenouridine(34) synthase MnmH n=2 Tax=Candidatus Synechococcus spongiarum TaxID=431041 RepID=A0A1T1C7L7_9SYNE|nr:tRNA 2-selenouridine(34) synthase MnmH [Cyanobacteria bacterium MAG APA_bin_95]OOV24513.1 tRNA 2-selenouridine(34) synthase MnmH [Candidatus Synechococcus spongiarum LMB bulk15M]
MVRSLSCDHFLKAGGPLLDVRSPGEFARGHIPGAHNLPLFSDEERAGVGTLYKHQGRRAAVRRGLELVGPRLAVLAEQAAALAEADANLRVHCWRGGLRSSSTAWLLETYDLSCTLLEGGYKAFRRWLRQALARSQPVVLLGGHTGSGKTDVLHALRSAGAQVLDLERLAHHRGSSFGGIGQPRQPTTEQFENEIAMALRAVSPHRVLWIEAESVQVGCCRIPPELFHQMQQAPLVELQRPDHERLDHLLATYGAMPRQELVEATRRIGKRLGPQRTRQAVDAIAAGNLRLACQVILSYYDRTYAHGLARSPHTPVPLVREGQSSAALAQQLLAMEPTLLDHSL